MYEPTAVSPGGYDGAQAVYPVYEWYPGAEVVEAVSGGEFARPVHIVGPGMGGQPVYFPNGLPSDRYYQEQQAAAYLAQQTRQPVVPETREAALARRLDWQARDMRLAREAAAERARHCREMAEARAAQAEAYRSARIRPPRGLAARLLGRGWLIPPPL